jgi:hypothetical protein
MFQHSDVAYNMYGFFGSQRISKSSLRYVINLMEQGALSEANNPEGS